MLKRLLSSLLLFPSLLLLRAAPPPRVRAKPAPTAHKSAAPSASAASATVYRLHLYALHTGEHLNVVYRIGNRYLPAALAKVNHLLRDWRTDTVKPYSLKELNLLHALMVRLGRPDGVIDIACGYRTLATNAMLRATTSGVALHSQHMLAKAIDIRVPGVRLARLRAAALALHRGGVGYYPKSDFVHVDVGPVRHW